MTDNIYTLDRLVKRYGQREACSIESLEVRRGEALGIIGPSGSGKSTLLRLLNFLEPQTSGTINFLGQPYDGRGSISLEVRRRMTLVFQSPLLFNTSVLNNVAYGLKLRGVKDAKARAAEFLEKLGMESLAREHPSTIVIVTHNVFQARRLADRTALLLDGKVVEVGPTEELFSDARDPRTRSFLGGEMVY